MSGIAEQMLKIAVDRLASRNRKPRRVFNIKQPSAAESRHKIFMLNIAKSFKNNFNNYKSDILNLYQGFRLDSFQRDINEILNRLDRDNEASIASAVAGVVAAANLTNSLALESWRDITTKSLEFDLSPFMGYPKKEMDKMIDWNTRLIQDMKRSQKKLVRQYIKQAVAEGWSRKKLSDKLEDVMGRQQRNRARLIASDQVGKLYGSIIRKYSIEAGVSQYRWQTRLDERVRERHDAMHAKIGRWDRRDLVAGLNNSGEKVVWKKKGGNLPIAHPLEEIACRCVGVPLFESYNKNQPKLEPQELNQQFETTS